ncbi:MAG: DUF349 domain-containing protein [Bacteroidales bacterium]|nr:DUF349 domain-containing protein [Bacteroidales bacterium]
MESKDTVSVEQAQEVKKPSAAELVLQTLEALKNKDEDSLKEKIEEFKSGMEAASASEEDMQEDVHEETAAAEDYSGMDREQLLKKMQEIVQNGDILAVRSQVDALRTQFYKIKENKAAQEPTEDGEVAETQELDPLEEQFKSLYSLYREKRNEINSQIEKQQLENLAVKKEIIEKIEKLINPEGFSKQTYEDFKTLQKQWNEVGKVPQAEAKQLAEAYHAQVEKFYYQAKIEKELRDLDLKVNTDNKIKLCERAEELIIQPKIVNAFKELQKLHEQWREIGPVIADKKEELWERFKLATSKINKRHLEYYDNLKKEQEQNYKAKTLICEKAEEIVATPCNSMKEWEAKSKEILELQQIWKLVGFAPKKYNTKVYERFRRSCDEFFGKKRDFYLQSREEEDNNLLIKEDLCAQAESMKDSTDWGKTTEFYKKLQAKWKTIGAVPRKNSEELWQRFRGACNAFFENKKKHFEEKDKEEEENLKLKEQIISEVESFQFAENDEDNIARLKEFQKRWLQTGAVPRPKRDKIFDRFRKAIDAQFNKINIDEAKRNEVKIKNLIESSLNSPSGYEKLRAEKDKIKTRIEGLRQQVILAENNLGFFSESKNAENMIESFKRKLEKSKAEIATLEKFSSMLSKAINEIVSKNKK